MRVTFKKIDSECDTQLVFQMGFNNKNRDPYGNENRAKDMGISKGLLNNIQDSNTLDEMMNKIRKWTLAQNKKYSNQTKTNLKLYKERWEKIHNQFSKTLVDVTDQQWAHSTYIVNLSCIHTGLIRGYENNEIVIFSLEKPHRILRLIAHELTMTHIWQFLNKNYSEELKNDRLMHFWGLMEISTVFILGFENGVKNMWTEDLRGGETSFLKTYPPLIELQKELIPEYKKKESFKSFIDIALRKINTKYRDTDFGA